MNKFFFDKIVIGTWPLSGDYGKVNLEVIQRTLESCYDNNLREFDTAPSYGNGFMEFCLGKVLGDRKDILINTKIGNVPFKGKTFKIDDLKTSFEQSLKRLSVDSVNVLFLHNPRSDIDNFEETIELMNLLKSEGKIKSSGVSLAKNHSYTQNFLNEFDFVQDDGNLLDMRFLNLKLPNHAKFMARSPLASGILSGKINKETLFQCDDHRSQWLKEDRLKSIMKRVDEIKKVSDLELIDLAKKFTLSNKKINKVIFGIKNVGHVESILESSDSLALSKDIEMQLVKLYKDDFGLKDESHLAL